MLQLKVLFYSWDNDAEPQEILVDVTNESMKDIEHKLQPTFTYRLGMQEYERLKAEGGHSTDLQELELMTTQDTYCEKYDNEDIIAYVGEEVYTRNDMDEMAHIGYTIGQELSDEIWEKTKGFTHTLDFIDKVAFTFWNAHKEIGEWEEYLSSKENKYPNAQSWDEYLMAYTREQLKAL